MNSRLEVVSEYLVACLILYLCCHLALAQASPSLGLSPPAPPFFLQWKYLLGAHTDNKIVVQGNGVALTHAIETLKVGQAKMPAAC